MKVKLFAFISVLFLFFSPAVFSATQSLRVSGDINIESVARDLGVEPGSETFILSQVRLRIDADLTEGVGATVSLINERLWGVDDDSDSRINLSLAYIQLDEVMDMPMAVRIGRQNLRYGNALIVGDPYTNQFSPDTPSAFADLSLRKSFDAARVILDYAPYTVDLVYAKIEEGDTSVRRDDQNLWGINLGYDWSNGHGITEAYFFYVNQGKEEIEDKRGHVNATGLRTQFHLSEHLTLGAEGAFQFGRKAWEGMGATDTLKAYAGQFVSQYRFLDELNSKINLRFTYFSGDSGSGSSYNAWQPLFEDQTPAEIINILFPNSNALCTVLGGTIVPREDVTLGLQWTWVRLANSYFHPSGLDLYAPDGDVFTGSRVYQVNPDKKNVGNEINAHMLYDYTEDVQFKLSGAWFIPGSFFDSANDNTAYSVRAGVNVDF